MKATASSPARRPSPCPEGLLAVYSSISADFKWTISLMLLDKDDPRKILAQDGSAVA